MKKALNLLLIVLLLFSITACDAKVKTNTKKTNTNTTNSSSTGTGTTNNNSNGTVTKVYETPVLKLESKSPCTILKEEKVKLNLIITNKSKINPDLLKKITWKTTDPSFKIDSNELTSIVSSISSDKTTSVYVIVGDVESNRIEIKAISKRTSIGNLEMKMSNNRKGYQLFDGEKITFDYKDNKNTKIYYTLDGTEVNLNSKEYVDGIDFDSPFKDANKIKDEEVGYESYYYPDNKKYRVLKAKAIYDDKESEEFERRIYKIEKSNICKDVLEIRNKLQIGETNKPGKCTDNYKENIDINDIGLSDTCINLDSLFFNKQTFNANLCYWDISKVTNLASLFNGAINFNQDLNKWDTSNVVEMGSMFVYCNFNGNISSWDVSNVDNMASMFFNASKFNCNISSWNVSKVNNMAGMFLAAKEFNQDISGWDVKNVTDHASFNTGCPGLEANNEAFTPAKFRK